VCGERESRADHRPASRARPGDPARRRPRPAVAPPAPPDRRPPPLPHPIAISTTAWLLLAIVIVAGAFLISERTPWLRLGDQANTWLLRLIAEVRTAWLSDVARAINAAGSGWAVTAVGLSVVVLTMVFRRWRHLLVFVGSLFFTEIVGEWIYSGLSRPRPYGISIIASWGGYSAPSPPVVTLTIFLMGAVYCLVVPGRPRTYAKIAVAVVIALFGLARVYLAVDHPDDVLFGVALGVAIPVTAFRFFTPNEVFPVVYRRGRTAHVDVTGRRGEAIRQAVSDQLGLTVAEIKPVGLESSAGSTPLRLRVEGAPDEYLFAKLYTKGHVRGDAPRHAAPLCPAGRLCQCGRPPARNRNLALLPANPMTQNSGHERRHSLQGGSMPTPATVTPAARSRRAVTALASVALVTFEAMAARKRLCTTAVEPGGARSSS
jgi:membrane-associated phospholipid phosphatase